MREGLLLIGRSGTVDVQMTASWRILGLFALGAGLSHGARPRSVRAPAIPATGSPRGASAAYPEPTLEWMPVQTDHFSWAPIAGGNFSSTFDIRVFSYDGYWAGGGQGPIWFYAGNEANVEKYVEATGLMWENAKAEGALLVFAEHRFYGESWPCGGEEPAMKSCLHYLTHEQAMADYVEVLGAIKESKGAEASPVIAFGGSYGGMLAAWLRIKYPATFAGAVASSAPILGFPGLPFYEGSGGGGGAEGSAAPYEGGASYWDVVAYGTTEAAGSDPDCGPNLATAFKLVASTSATLEGRQQLEASFGLCPGVLASEEDADGYRLSMRLLLAYDDYAMGNYPFSSTYISVDAPLPPFPMRGACGVMGSPDPASASDAAILDAAGASVNLLFNASGSVTCFEELPPRSDEGEDGIWEVQWCTELMCQETYFTRRSPSAESGLPDIWPPYSFDLAWVGQHCAKVLGPSFAPRPGWVSGSYYGAKAGCPATGGAAGGSLLAPGALPAVSGGSRIVFANGEYDPWRAAGVTVNDTAKEIVALFVAEVQQPA